ncbi:MYD88 family protein [Megaselia abdita]
MTQSIPLDYLSKKTRAILSVLNNKKCIKSETGSPRDWRGIIELCELHKTHYGIVERSYDHMDEILRIWCSSDSDHPKANVENLLRFLQEIDRFDVLEDIRETIEEDIKNYEEHIESERKYEQLKVCSLPKDKFVCTVQDLERLKENKPLKIYDAFILFEDEDIDFVETLYERLDKFELCKKSDLLTTNFEHTAVVELIEKRCRKVIAVISKHFLNNTSNANRFLVDFAQAEQIETGARRIIPVILERELERRLPSNLKFLHKICFYKESNLYDFWQILKSNITDTSSFSTSRVERSISAEIDDNPVAHSPQPPSQPPSSMNTTVNATSSNSVDDPNSTDLTTNGEKKKKIKKRLRLPFIKSSKNT